MAFKIPLLQSKSLSEGYFEGLPSFAWGDVTEKDEIGRGSFGSVMKGKYSTKGKVVGVKRFFGEGNLHLKNISTLRIFHTPHILHSIFSTLRIFHTPHLPHSAVRTPHFPLNL